MRRGRWLSHRKIDPYLDAAGAPMAPPRRRPLLSCGGGPGRPSAKEACALMWLSADGSKATEAAALMRQAPRRSHYVKSPRP